MADNRFMNGRMPQGSKRLLAAAVALAAAALLSGCETNNHVIVGSVPQDYRTNHPIIVAEREHTTDIPVASGDRRLTMALKETVRGFAQDYEANATGAVRIMVPSGSLNAAAASLVTRDIRATLVRAGVPSNRIIETPYAAAPTGDAAPVRLSYLATTAATAPCGRWPEDLTNDTSQNREYANFGCASQSNLAAQIANPADLIAPRGMTPVDAERRQNVISDYRDNGAIAGGQSQ